MTTIDRPLTGESHGARRVTSGLPEAPATDCLPGRDFYDVGGAR